MRWLSPLGLELSTAVLYLTSKVFAQSVPSPNINLEPLGEVALAGNFDAISIYNNRNQREVFRSNGSSSIVAELPDGSYEVLISTDASIEAMCPFVLKDGRFIGLIVGGNFTSIGGINARSIALFDPNKRTVSPHPGIQGTVSSLLCDQDTETVYVGGTFDAAASKNAIAWIAAGSWANLPFAGFDAPVTSITKAPNGHVVFGGSFTGLGNSSMAIQNGRETQAISISSANVSAGSTTNTAEYSDPRNVICPGNGTSSSSAWLLRDTTPGFWRADFAFGFEPTKLRLWNTNIDGRGTRTWRFTAHPINGIMNFTYADPVTGEDRYCDSQCPLAQNDSLPYQDFYFVNTVGMNSFSIDVSDWYGNGGGLNGIEIFQNDIFSYAIGAFNEPSCSGSTTLSSATTTGPWFRTPSRQSVSDYLTVVTGPTTVNTTEIVFTPNVQRDGNYSIIVYTPGCLQDSSCSARGIVNVTGTLTSGASTSFSTLIYQTNDFDKYDQVFQGAVDATSSSFRPSITIRASGFQTDQLIVASRVKFNFVNSTGGLNGLYDFDPNQAVVDTDFSKSAINNAGTMLRPNARFRTLVTEGDTIYAAGQFSDDVFQNIMAFSDNNASSLPGQGLNSAVLDMLSLNDYLYVCGNFTNTNEDSVEGLNNIAAYSYSTRSWSSLGNGVNGPTTSIGTIQINTTNNQPETVIVFSGDFTSIRSSGSNAAKRANGLAVWVPSSQSWLANLNDIPRLSYAGQLSSITTLPNGTWLGAGTLLSQGLDVSGAAGLRSSSGSTTLRRLPIDISSNPVQSSLAKRELTGQQNVSGVVTGAYDRESNRNLTIFGGRFSAIARDGSTIENLMFLDGNANNSAYGLGPGIGTNSTFLSLKVQNDLLFAGGSVSGQVREAEINGLVVYDLQENNYRTPQPAALSGDNVIVNSIVAQSGSSQIYVGGAFERTSQGLSCPCVCMYDTSTNQWSAVGSGLDGTIMALFWASETSLMAAGNLTVSGNQTSLATYNTLDQSWTVMNQLDVPGSVSAFAPATSDGNRFWVAGTANNGSTFLMEIDGDTNRPVPDAFGPGTIVRGLQVLELTDDHGSTPYLDRDQALLVTGQLNLTDFGSASAALFNGTAFTPFILSSTDEGKAGSISQMFTSKTNPLRSSRRGRSRGIVVLVALCAALGTIFLIVLLGMLLNRLQRRRAGYSQLTGDTYTEKPNFTRVPPAELLSSMNKRNAAPNV